MLWLLLLLKIHIDIKNPLHSNNSMNSGYLSQYFDGVAVKQLSSVEIDVLTSNQHEFNGVEGLRNILGEPDEKVRYTAKFLYLTDYDDEPVTEVGFLTWYDARQKARTEREVMRREYRLYFPANIVSQCANAGDVLVIAKQKDNTLLAIVAEKNTTIARQVLWLFGFSELKHPGFSIREELETEQDRIEFSSGCILESIGIQVEASGQSFLDDMLSRFQGKFPSTKEFSSYARSTLPDISPQDSHDSVLMAWITREEILFRTLEKYFISEKLQKGFGDNTEGAVSYFKSVINRRKSRSGLALENHLQHLFRECNIKYSRTPVTENRSKPDFIFPGQDKYHDSNFNPLNLTMLGVKSSCKDRWRQVLSEAERIKRKHLLTLEAAISSHQISEMQAKNLQLVLPEELHRSYSINQQKWLMSVENFIHLVTERQQLFMVK